MKQSKFNYDGMWYDARAAQAVPANDHSYPYPLVPASTNKAEYASIAIPIAVLGAENEMSHDSMCFGSILHWDERSIIWRLSRKLTN